MSHPPPQDLDDKALLDRAERNRGKVRLLVAALGVAGVATGIGAFQWSRGTGTGEDWSRWFPIVIVVITMAQMVLIQVSHRRDPAGERTVRLQGDRAGRVYRGLVMFTGGALIVCSVFQTLTAISQGGHTWRGLAMQGVIWALALMAFTGWSSAPAVRRVVNDERTLENRQRGVMAGVWTFFLAALVLLGLTQVKPEWLIAFLPALLSAPLAVACWRFALLERADARDE